MNTLATPGIIIIERDVLRPTFNSKVESEIGRPGGEVEIIIGGKSYYTPINPVDGSWSWTPDFDLPEGAYSLSIRAIDNAGNFSIAELYNLVISTTPLEAPTLLNLYDNVGDKTGSFDISTATDDRRPALTGDAKPGAVVVLMRGGEEIGSAVADPVTGLWTLEPNVDLQDGGNSLTLVTRDIFAGKGRESAESEPFTILIAADGSDNGNDNGGIALISHGWDDSGENVGELNSGALTSDTTPTLYGSAPADSIVRVQYRAENGRWVDGGNAVNRPDGEWSWTAPELGAGNWEFRVSAAASGGWSDEFLLEIDSAAQSGMRITHALDNEGPYTGELASGAITDDRTPTLHGRAEANSLVYVHGEYNGNGSWGPLGSVLAGPDGSWSLTTTPLVIVGSWRLQAGASATADPLADTFALDIINPGSRAPTILGAWDDIGNVTGQIENGMTTNDTTPELRGIAEANSVVMIEFGRPGEPYDTSHSVIANARGEWSFTPPAPLEQGVWVFRTKAANGSSYSNSWGINVAEIEVNTFTHNFEDADTGIISSGWKYGQLTLSALDSGSSFNISRVAGIGKVLLLTSPSTGTTELAKARIDFNEPVNFVQLDAIDWESADSYVSFHNSAGAEIGRIYSTNIANMAREELSFYTTGNDIAYMQFYLTAPKQHTGFYVDDIILKQNYIPPIELDSARSSLYDVNGAELELINGDDGVETLVMSGQQQTMVMSEVAEQFSSVEVVDITGSGDNLLALSIGDVLEHGGRDLFIDDGKLQFMVQGNEGDTVQLDDLLPDGTDSGDWLTQNGTVTVAGVEYQVFSHSGEEAEVLIQQGIKAELI